MKYWLLICPSILLIFIISCKSNDPIQNNGDISNSTINNIVNKVNIDSLMFFVKQLSGVTPVLIEGKSDTIKSRQVDNSFHKLAVKYLSAKLKSFGFETQLQNISGTSTGQNILATQRGTKFPSKKYVLCAHYDSYSSSINAPGADDNASGVAAVLEAARILSKYKPEYTIVYALWDQEEPGLIGSRYYAGKAAIGGDTIAGVINIDMIAYDSNADEKCWVHSGGDDYSKIIVSEMVENNNIYKIGLNLNNAVLSASESDQISFWDKGFSAVNVQEDFWNDYDKQLHTSNDVTQLFSTKYFHDCSKLIISSIASLSIVKNP